MLAMRSMVLVPIVGWVGRATPCPLRPWGIRARPNPAKPPSQQQGGPRRATSDLLAAEMGTLRFAHPTSVNPVGWMSAAKSTDAGGGLRCACPPYGFADRAARSNVGWVERSTVGWVERSAVGWVERSAVGWVERSAVGWVERSETQQMAATSSPLSARPRIERRLPGYDARQGYPVPPSQAYARRTQPTIGRPSLGGVR